MSAAYWAVVPAAGVGRRMGAQRPKQYLEVAGKQVIEHTLDGLRAHPRIAAVVVVVAAGDPWWERVAVPAGKRTITAPGGPERCHSVRNGLEVLAGMAADDDWVLVHDAARPCLAASDVDALIGAVGEADCGGLLGVPVGDTLKRVAEDGTVRATVPRDGLWRALTPQMFRLRPLRQALERCVAEGVVPTDECEAMERFAGASGAGRPRMVEGAPTNIKVTRAGDLALVEQYFAGRAEAARGD